MLYIGIDPGKSGACAMLGVGDGGQQVSVFAWDSERFVAEMRAVGKQVRDHGMKALACVEKVGARPKQGVVSTFSFGKSAGFIEGVLVSCGVPYQLVVPRRWKHTFGLNNDKSESIETCKRLFPGICLKRNDRCRVESDGMAEALLIAEFARRLHGGDVL